MVVTLTVTLSPAEVTFTCTVEPEDVPLVRLQVVSLALGSGVQVSVAAPVNPPLGVSAGVVDPLWPGLAMLTEPAGVTLSGLSTTRDCGTETVAEV
jgi:hypothetical protein